MLLMVVYIVRLLQPCQNVNPVNTWEYNIPVAFKIYRNTVARNELDNRLIQTYFTGSCVLTSRYRRTLYGMRPT
jgi:hypothetical protein